MTLGKRKKHLNFKVNSIRQSCHFTGRKRETFNYISIVLTLLILTFLNLFYCFFKFNNLLLTKSKIFKLNEQTNKQKQSSTCEI